MMPYFRFPFTLYLYLFVESEIRALIQKSGSYTPLQLFNKVPIFFPQMSNKYTSKSPNQITQVTKYTLITNKRNKICKIFLIDSKEQTFFLKYKVNFVLFAGIYHYQQSTYSLWSIFLPPTPINGSQISTKKNLNNC